MTRLFASNMAFALVLALALQSGPGMTVDAAEKKKVDTRALRKDARVADAIHLLEEWVDAQLAYEKLPRVSMAIVYDQDLLWSRGFGYADLESGKPATPETIYSICSISKLFTSIGVMQMWDAGKLRLDDRVADLVPWLKIEVTDPEAFPITVRSILSHSSGLPRESDHPYWTGPDFPFPTREEIIERITSQKTLHPASTYYQYSNLGLTLAGELIIQLSGQPYGEYAREKILEPLGLSSTTPEIPQDQKGKRFATGYSTLSREGERKPMPFFQTRGIAPAAGYASTVENLARFASWQFRLLEHGGEEVLRASTLREMHRVQWVDPDWKQSRYRGLGFGVWRDNGTTFVGHGGSCPGFRSHLSLDMKDQIAAVFMTNAGINGARLYTRRAHEIVGGAIKQAVKDPAEGKKTDRAAEDYAGLYRDDWAETVLVPWEGGLAAIYFPTDNPMESIDKLKYEKKDLFRRLRDDGTLAEEVRFERDQKGKVTRLLWHGNYSAKLR